LTLLGTETVNTESYQRIISNAELIQELGNAPAILRDIAKRSSPQDSKHLRAIAVMLEELPNREVLLKAVAHALQAYQLLSLKDNVGYEQAASSLGLSYSTCKQTINAMAAGGLEFDLKKAKGKKPSPKGGRPRVGKSVKNAL
jgi:hypothetical protein